MNPFEEFSHELEKSDLLKNTTPQEEHFEHSLYEIKETLLAAAKLIEAAYVLIEELDREYGSE